MTEQTSTYKVKPGQTIFHRGIVYNGGAQVELSAEKALVHAPNIELVKEPKTTEAKKIAEPKDVPGKS